MILYKSLSQSIDMSKRIYNLSEIELLRLNPRVGRKLR